MLLGIATDGLCRILYVPRLGFLAMAVRPSTNALTTQSTRPDDISSMTSSRDFSDLMVALGAKRRATASLAEPTSTAMFTSGLLMSVQVLASRPFLSMAPNGCGNTVALKSTTSARCGVGLRAKPRSILFDCRSRIEFPYVDSVYSSLTSRSLAMSLAISIEKPDQLPVARSLLKYGNSPGSTAMRSTLLARMRSGFLSGAGWAVAGGA